MWPNRYLTSQRFEAMQQELSDLRQEREALRQNNSALRRHLNEFLSKERWLTATFERLRSDTADLRQPASSSTETQVSTYHELIDYLKNLSHDKIRLSEKLRREKELRAQTEEEASAATARYQKVTLEMMTKLNTLKTRSEELYDEQCASEWRKLQQAIDVWTRRTFLDKSAMTRMTIQDLDWTKEFFMLPEDMLQDLHGKRAYIQGTIAGILFNTVFNFLFACSPTTRLEKIFSTIGKSVRGSGSSYTWEAWRSATSKALENRAAFEKHRLDNACERLSRTVDTLFGDYYSRDVEKDKIHRILHQLFTDCLTFKTKLERQESDYVIRQSPPGTVYHKEQMTSLNFKEEDGSIVDLSIWPSLYKVSFNDEELLIEREAVWTKKPIQVNNLGTGDLYDSEKESRQELKSEEDDDDLSLIMLES